LKDQAGNAKIELERLTSYYIGIFVPRFSYTAVYHNNNNNNNNNNVSI